MMTGVPTAVRAETEEGQNQRMVGVTPKLWALTPAPTGLATLMSPLPAPAGTLATSSVSDCTVNCGLVTSLNRTSVTPTNPAPKTCTSVPTLPAEGENRVMVGAEPT